MLVPHPGRVPVHVPEEGLLPPVHHPHRPSSVERQQAGVDLHRQVLPGPERATHPGQCQPHLLLRQAEARRDLLPVGVQPLRRHEEIDAAVRRRHRQPRLRAEEGLILHTDLVLADHHDLRRRRVGIAMPDRLVSHHVAFGMDLDRRLESKTAVRASVNGGSSSYSTTIFSSARRAVCGSAAARITTGSPWYRTSPMARTG